MRSSRRRRAPTNTFPQYATGARLRLSLEDTRGFEHLTAYEIVAANGDGEATALPEDVRGRVPPSLRRVADAFRTNARPVACDACEMPYMLPNHVRRPHRGTNRPVLAAEWSWLDGSPLAK